MEIGGWALTTDMASEFNAGAMAQSTKDTSPTTREMVKAALSAQTDTYTTVIGFTMCNMAEAA